jgi:hypothetical protein
MFLKYATEIALQLAHNPCTRKKRFLAKTSGNPEVFIQNLRNLDRIAAIKYERLHEEFLTTRRAICG